MEEDQEREILSSVSFVSTISASSSVHHPKPPDGPKPSSQRFHTKMSGKVVRSPYLATSTPYPNKKRQKRFSDNKYDGHFQDIRDLWAKPLKRLPHSSGSSFLRSLMMTGGFPSAIAAGTSLNKRKRTHSTSGPPKTKKERTKHNSVRSAAAPLTSDSGQLDAIALRDETVRLKQLLNAVLAERDLAKAQLGKAEAEIGRKDKQIEDLLAAGHVPSRDTTRSLVGGSRKAVPQFTSSTISSLRVKLHSLESALREKERELAALRSDIGVTRLREMEIQTETYYREVCRLTRLLSERGGETSERSQRDAQIKLKALNKATIKMATQLEELEQQNSQLLQKLHAYESDGGHGPETVTHNEQGLRGSIADRYVDYKRSQLLSAIVDLELKIREKDSSLKSLLSDLDSKKAHYERRIGELTGAQTDSITLVQSLQTKVKELEASRDKLENVVRKLKDDRTHYRTVAESTQASLASVQESLESEKINKSGVIHELEVLREKHQNEMAAIEHARKLASRRSRVFTPEKERQQEAASTLQAHWKKRQASVKQRRFEDERDQAVLDLQSALRGHMARKQMMQGSKVNEKEHRLNSIKDCSMDYSISEDSDGGPSEMSDAVETIQSALRGYMARQMAMQDLRSRSSSPRATHSLTVEEMWRDSNDRVGGSSVSQLTQHHPPVNRLPEKEWSDRSVHSALRKKRHVPSSSPWRSALEKGSSDEDSSHLLPVQQFLHLDHSLSSSNGLEETPFNTTEHVLLRDEFC